MNTHPTQQRHRLFVAVPLFAAIVLTTLLSGVMDGAVAGNLSEGAGDIAAGEASRDVFVGDDSLVRLAPGSTGNLEDNQLHLVAGTVLVASRGIAAVSTEDALVRGWSGAFQLAKNNDGITIAAVSTPVLVSTEQGMTIVPAGSQWTSAPLSASFTDDPSAWYAARETVPLPEHFLREYLPLSDDLLARIQPQNTVALDTVLPPLLGQGLRFGVAREEAQERHADLVLSQLSAALNDGNMQRVGDLLLAPGTEDILHSESGKVQMPRLLHQAAINGQAALFLPFFITDHERWLLGAFHPAIRDQILVLPVPGDIDAARLELAVILLPESDHQGTAIVPLSALQWKGMLERTLDGREDASAFLSALVPVVTEQILALRDALYPERMLRYSTMLTQTAEAYRSDLPSDIQQMLQSLVHLEDTVLQVPAEEIVVEEEEIPAESSASSSSVAFNADEIAYAARARLGALGCMFTAQTAIDVSSPTRADIRNVVFAGAAGDQLLSFSLDPSTDMVVDIVKDGQLLPYSLSLEKYLEWVKGEG